MSRCPICNEDKRAFCSCGFCLDCINKFTHEGCSKYVKEKEKENYEKNCLGIED